MKTVAQPEDVAPGQEKTSRDGEFVPAASLSSEAVPVRPAHAGGRDQAAWQTHLAGPPPDLITLLQRLLI